MALHEFTSRFGMIDTLLTWHLKQAPSRIHHGARQDCAMHERMRATNQISSFDQTIYANISIKGERIYQSRSKLSLEYVAPICYGFRASGKCDLFPIAHPVQR